MIVGFDKSVLPSGLTLLTQRMADRRSVALGVWVRTGARDERPEHLGLAHFIEHMMFKGTARRDARAIAASLESLGGHLDAFTTREYVCYSARALSEHLPEVVDVLGDILGHSRYDTAEVEREKSVVREEIDAYEDNPEEKVADLLAEQLWGDHPLGRPILGHVETIEHFTPDLLREDVSRRYRADQLVVTAAGGLEHGDLVALLASRLEEHRGASPVRGPAPLAFAPTVRHVERDVNQLYLSLGTRAVAYGHRSRWGLYVLETLLGAGMSSRLFQSIREEAGLAYSVFSALDFHRDTGALSIHLGVSPERGREALTRLRAELDRLMLEGPTDAEVESARAQLRGSVVMGQESTSNRMVHLARQELYTGAYQSPDEQVASIEAVTREEVATLAAVYLRPGRFTLTALGPAVGEPLAEADWPVEPALARDAAA